MDRRFKKKRPGSSVDLFFDDSADATEARERFRGNTPHQGKCYAAFARVESKLDGKRKAR
jgi:hypothetical protein